MSEIQHNPDLQDILDSYPEEVDFVPQLLLASLTYLYAQLSEFRMQGMIQVAGSVLDFMLKENEAFQDLPAATQEQLLLLNTRLAEEFSKDPDKALFTIASIQFDLQERMKDIFSKPQ